MRIECLSPEQQERLGARLAALAPAACIIYLEGELGTGKTTLVRGFLRGLGHAGNVKSPTYTLLEPYETATRRCFHFDLYRLGAAEELEYLGIRDLLAQEAILLIEWPERGKGGLPSPDLRIAIHYLEEGRELELTADSAAGEELVRRLAAEGSREVNK